jgi:hypothetical protein
MSTTKTGPGAGAGYAGSVQDLEADLARERDLEAARRRDELERLTGQAHHERSLADLAEDVRSAEASRAEREGSRTADAKLQRLFLESRDAGERTRIAAHMARSGESRALRLERLRTANLKILVPVLLGFAAWSTTGVQAGAARLMVLSTRDPMWWALWILEPVLIGAVVWVIIARARLAASGGRLSAQAVKIAAGCLGTSIVLNLIAAVPGTGKGGWAGAAVVLGAMLAHLIGPVGAAATAHLIGVVDGSISDADPWTDHGQKVPLLADMEIEFGRSARPRPADIPADIPADMSAGALADQVVTLPETASPLIESAGRADIPEPMSAPVPVADIPAAITVEDVFQSGSGAELWQAMPLVSAPGHDGTSPDITIEDPFTGDTQTGGDESTGRDEESLRRRLADMLAVRPDLTGDQIGAVLEVSGRHGRRLKNEVLAADDVS